MFTRSIRAAHRQQFYPPPSPIGEKGEKIGALRDVDRPDPKEIVWPAKAGAQRCALMRQYFQEKKEVLHR